MYNFTAVCIHELDQYFIKAKQW